MSIWPGIAATGGVAAAARAAKRSYRQGRGGRCSPFAPLVEHRSEVPALLGAKRRRRALFGSAVKPGEREPAEQQDQDWPAPQQQRRHFKWRPEQDKIAIAGADEGDHLV